MKKNLKQMLEDAAFAARYQKLTERQKKYFTIMFPCSGVLYLEGKSGIAKSSTLRTIASKLNLKFIDLRLATMDEVDLGVYPYPKNVNHVHTLSHLVPEWAVDANNAQNEGYDGALIVFEELNRAPLPVRNASLGILLERRIGHNFVFNDSVYMAACGNLGIEDNNDVEEFDAALSSRLIRLRHSITLDEWIDDFANEHVHPFIVSYLKAYPTEFDPDYKNKDSRVYVNPRTWTFFSDMIVAKHGLESSAQEISETIKGFAYDYLGQHATRLLRHLSDIARYNLRTILAQDDINYSAIPREVKSEIIQEIKKIDINQLNDSEENNQVRRLQKFLESCDADLVGSFISILFLEKGTERFELLKSSKFQNLIFSNQYLANCFHKILSYMENKSPRKPRKSVTEGR
ncbi:MAG: hypothetical protein NZM06_06790 [Chloroherpetonaceae bacterium]|nr:hypothetical protein [Chloroherpetonaceae bacterium]MDW8437660.1 hypothetical protein [Chloroherpetonaceae bacterium]